MRSKKFWFLTAFFLVLVLGFCLALGRFIPGFGKVKLPVLSQVRSFSFLDQEGRRITDKDVEGKVYVAEYFFTTCKGICPRMNSNLKGVLGKFANESDFRILSFSVDPRTDTVARLRKYGDSLGIDPSKWWLLTGPKDSLYSLARGSYLLDNPDNNAGNIDEQFIHTQFVALVDKDGQVRKIYDSLKKEELEELETDIKRLLEESTSTPRFNNSLFNNNPS